MQATTQQTTTRLPLLRLGHTGEHVRTLQILLNRRLAELGVAPPQRSTSSSLILEDGLFGNQTLATVKYLQCVICQDVDGLAGPKTWSYLENGPAGLPTLRTGSTGREVERIQAMFFLPYSGTFNSQTQRTIKRYQRNHQLRANGIIDANTWTQILFDRVDARFCDFHMTP